MKMHSDWTTHLSLSTGGLVSRDYIALAFSKSGGVEIPLAPPGNLVLAECCFKDKAFAATVDGFG
jgi:hypothetical protein